MATIILLMSMDEVEAYGEERIREVIEMAGEEDVEVEVFKDTGRVVVTGGNCRAEELQYQLTHKLGVGISIVSETEAPPKFEFCSSSSPSCCCSDSSCSDDEEDDDDDEEEDEDEDNYAQMASLSLYDMCLPATAIPEPSWQDQPVADPSRYFFHQFDYIPSYSED